MTVPATVQKSKLVHVEDLTDRGSELPRMIRSGQAYLKVVAYPWGVEFDLCEREGQT